MRPFKLVMMRETVRLTTASTDAVQILTVPAKCLGTYDDLLASMWAEKLFAQARTCSGDGARFAKGLS